MCSGNGIKSTTIIRSKRDPTNAQVVHVDGNPSSITTHDVYKAVSEVFGSSNSFDLTKLQIKSVGSQEVVVETIGEDSTRKEEHSTRRKKKLSALADEWPSTQPSPYHECIGQ